MVVTPNLLNPVLGLLLVNPANEIQQLAKEIGMEGRVRTIACGGAGVAMLELEQTLIDCIQSGYWLVVQNAHLHEEPFSRSMLNLFKVLISHKAVTRILKPSIISHNFWYGLLYHG